MTKKNDAPLLLNKYLAHAGYASRRKAAMLIKQGEVSVNHFVITDPAYRLKPSDQVRIKGKIVKPEQFVYVLLNKPRGVVTTASDERGRPTVLDIVKVKNARLYPVGRLDINTSGLLLLTNDGELAHRLSHPKYEIAKKYVVTLHRSLEEKDLAAIKRGVRLSDGLVRVHEISPASRHHKDTVYISLHSGQNRVVRRLFEYFSYFVERLDRVMYAGLTKKGLPVGAWRYVTEREVKKLKNSVKLNKDQ